jgi:hypothetical protein
MMTTPVAGSTRELIALWFGILGPPIIWATRIAVSYVLVPYACWWDWIAVLHLVTLAALAATAFAGWVAWGRWRAVGKGFEVDLGGTDTRSRFMAIAGMLSTGVFLLVIAAEGLANVIIHPCQTAGGPV